MPTLAGRKSSRFEFNYLVFCCSSFLLMPNEAKIVCFPLASAEDAAPVTSILCFLRLPRKKCCYYILCGRPSDDVSKECYLEANFRLQAQ